MTITEVATQMKPPILVELTIVTKSEFSTDTLTLTYVFIRKRKTGILRNSSVASSQDIASFGYEEITLKVKIVKEFRLDTYVPSISYLPCNIRIGCSIEAKTGINLSAVSTKHTRITV